MKDVTISPLSRLLIPVKNIDLFRNTLPFLEMAARIMKEDLERIDLLHVVGGSFLTEHLNNIDIRAGHVLSSEVMQRLRDRHHQELVRPLLADIQALLDSSKVTLRGKIRVEDGDPVKKLCSVCEDEHYSTLVVSRRKKDEGSEMDTVVSGVLHHYLNASVYVIGENGFPAGRSPAARIMIGVDGSQASHRAVREAALLLSRAASEVEEVALVNVRDPSCFFDDSGTNCQEASETGFNCIRDAERVLVEAGVDAAKIVPMLLFGRPGETLTTYASSFDATICFIGRRDRSNIARVLLGSVCGDMINHCRKTTLALVS
ncbi:universal stress protein [Desulforhopalus singaporensis]|uniref:Nucleotide-binding universal stress protein, UspA family n=1 Tax=Desulforhopalus singaporensis TaxID=91360 RepID=A0A1H0L917_9BACT|nr:universal stress protein [Desulforhopalus singaporensis]SDO64562.1 Nucleotide-binding universal stress protein, UspA family [Desulforhopalus singaporensis]